MLCLITGYFPRPLEVLHDSVYVHRALARSGSGRGCGAGVLGTQAGPGFVGLRPRLEDLKPGSVILWRLVCSQAEQLVLMGAEQLYVMSSRRPVSLSESMVDGFQSTFHDPGGSPLPLLVQQGQLKVEYTDLGRNRALSRLLWPPGKNLVRRAFCEQEKGMFKYEGSQVEQTYPVSERTPFMIPPTPRESKCY